MKPELRFVRGWLLSSAELFEDNTLPAFFRSSKWGQHYLYTHKDSSVFCHQGQHLSLCLIGHAYDPLEIVSDERELLARIADADDYRERINRLTGVFVLFVDDGKHIWAEQDACGIMPLYYGKIDGTIVLTNYAQLAADIFHLEMDPKIRRYIDAPFYKIGIRQLCGIDSAFEALKMLTANTRIDISTLEVDRFFPNTPPPVATPETYTQIENILKNSIRCCFEKWGHNVSVSLTGGVDSRMTFAAVTAFKDEFSYFSFVSNAAETRDAQAAAALCATMGVEHTIYPIPDNNEKCPGFEAFRELVEHNTSRMLKPTDNEIRKILTLSHPMQGRVEIKSHVSEVGRAFYFKKLGRKSFGRTLSPRDMSNLAKRNMFQRSILRDMDRSFAEFTAKTSFAHLPEGYEPTDMFYWENRMPLWAALTKQSFDVSHETTIIYNNRHLLNLFLSFPLAERVADIPQKKIIHDLNPLLSDLSESHNAMKGWKRIWMEKIFFTLNSKLC